VIQQGGHYAVALSGNIQPHPENGELRVEPMELTGEFMGLFVPDYEKVDQAKDHRLHSLGKIISETMSIHAAATELLATEQWDFAGIYYSGIDHFGHGFMNYHPPQLPWVSDDDFAIYQHVIANAYRYHDAMLGTLMGLADQNTTIILMSDHGFHPDHLRPAYIPAEPAGPAVEHRHFGILCLKGPALKANEQIYGASLLDICPTILTLFDLQPGKDMDGKVLVTAFKTPPTVEPIESWDTIPGQAGTHPPETQLDPVASAQAFKQLVALGYVAPPGATTSTEVPFFFPISARAKGEVMEMRPFLASASGSPTICHTAFLSVSSSTSVTVAPNLMVSPESLLMSIISARASLSSNSAMRPSLWDCSSLAA